MNKSDGKLRVDVDDSDLLRSSSVSGPRGAAGCGVSSRGASAGPGGASRGNAPPPEEPAHPSERAAGTAGIGQRYSIHTHISGHPTIWHYINNKT